MHRSSEIGVKSSGRRQKGQGLAEVKQGIWLARSEKPSEGTFNRSYDRGLEIPESVSIFLGIAVLVVSEANGENALCYEDIRYL